MYYIWHNSLWSGATRGVSEYLDTPQVVRRWR